MNSEEGSVGRGENSIAEGVACRQGIDHKGGLCLCGPPKDSITGQKIDTRTGIRYGEAR